MRNVRKNFIQRGDIMQARMELVGKGGAMKAYLKGIQTRDPSTVLNTIGNQGVGALARATPIGETGRTSAGWRSSVSKVAKGYELSFTNVGHPETTANVALLLQYGHGTGTGGYVQGINYINPALQSIFATGTEALIKELSR